MDEPSTAAGIMGANVFGPEGERLGQIEDIHFDVVDWKILAVMIGHGGFMGLGEEVDPLDWRLLRWDAELEGYVTGVPLDDEGDAAPAGLAPA
ncbi:PRC-barrel domain-containing protein [Wenxinia saemankumensis]|uniref:PRC-barrel domain-containing protein n=1 Tax=Wenxinia saemankumensis TaxID=1447782 RepID=A0A1M6FPB4_9RHOB|nr:PRC-barrel domain-containing protein [Wenxinia saemankumensis]SHI99514.1 PRC-barrel domain-containing protein [Wenxinia saemankumensis]